MDTKKDIGSAIKNHLDNYISSPDESLWLSIEKKIKKRRKKIIILWWFGGLGFLALISLIVMLGFSKGPKIETDNQPIIISSNKDLNISDVDTKTKKEVQKKDLINNKIINNSNTISKSNKKEYFILSSKNSSPTTKTEEDNTIKKHNSINTKNKLKSIVNGNIEVNQIVKNDSVIIPEKKSLIDSIKVKEKKKQPLQKDSIKGNHSKWSVSIYPTINYYGNFSNKSSIDARLDTINNVNRSSQFSLSYGGFFSYYSTSRFSIRIGANKLTLNQTTEGIENRSALLFNLTNVQLTSSLTDNNIQDFINSNNTIQLRQELDYLEIPLEIRYKFLERKISLSSISGLSFMHLLENNIILEGSENNITLGKASNLNDINVSLNIGVGFQTKLFKKFYLNIEPLLKYQIKPFSNSTNSNPFIFNIFSGIEYKF